jgi:hypothetical protein
MRTVTVTVLARNLCRILDHAESRGEEVEVVRSKRSVELQSPGHDRLGIRKTAIQSDRVACRSENSHNRRIGDTVSDDEQASGTSLINETTLKDLPG